jgi:TatD DNase family protein
MSPEPYRGRRNDPGRLIHMAQKLAQIRNLPVEEIIKITTENAKRLYRI